MRAVTFPGGREIEFVDFPDPVPGAGKVVIEVRASGFCGSDLHAYRRPGGTPPSTRHMFPEGPVIAGHEPCGIVVATGPGVPEGLCKVGDRVMVYHYWGCDACNHCRTGWHQHCEEVPVHSYGNNDHGAHAPYMKLPASTILPLPDGLSFTAGAAISCGTGTAYGALRRLGVSGRDTLVVVGQGPVGLAATQLAKAMGARVVALDVSHDRLARARDFGSDAVVDATGTDTVEAIRALTRGAGADLSIDTSGNSAGRATAVRCLKTWGRTAFIGEGGDATFNVSSDLIRRQITVMGSWTFSSAIQVECAQFVQDRDIDVDAVFTDFWRLDEAKEAYELFDTQATGKAAFRFG